MKELKMSCSNDDEITNDLSDFLADQNDNFEIEIDFVQDKRRNLDLRFQKCLPHLNDEEYERIVEHAEKIRGKKPSS